MNAMFRDDTLVGDGHEGKAEADSTKELVGRAVKSAREATGMSMRSLASRCGVSQPFLSQVERGTAAPSLSTLYRIAEALGTTPAALLPARPAASQPVLVRAGEGERFPLNDKANAAVGRLLLSDEGHVLEMYDYDLRPGADVDAWFASEGDLLVFVIEGRLDVLMNEGVRYQLGAGDTLLHANEVPHRWDLPSDEHTRVLLIAVRRPDPGENTSPRPS